MQQNFTKNNTKQHNANTKYKTKSKTNQLVAYDLHLTPL